MTRDHYKSGRKETRNKKKEREEYEKIRAGNETQ